MQSRVLRVATLLLDLVACGDDAKLAADANRPTGRGPDVAAANGIAVPTGTLLGSVLGASADGTVLNGTAMDMNGVPKTFTMRLPAGALYVP